MLRAAARSGTISAMQRAAGWGLLTVVTAAVAAGACTGGGGGGGGCSDAAPCPNGYSCSQGLCVPASGGSAGLDASAGAAGAAGSGAGAGGLGGAGGSGGGSGAGASGGAAGASGGAGASGSAGASGNAGASGSAGAGGAPCNPVLIDDLEQGLAGKIPICDGRIGGWFTTNDGLSGTTQWPIPNPTPGAPFPYVTPGANGTGHAVRSYGTCGSGTGAWGAMLGVTLNDPGSGAQLWNAASKGYTGVRFAARRDAAGASSVRVDFPDRYTDPIGGQCTTGCYDHWGTTVSLSTSWTTYTIHWDELSSGTWGVPDESFDPTGIVTIQWVFPATTSGFDIFIDAVVLVSN
jgi:hypothetical protein